MALIEQPLLVLQTARGRIAAGCTYDDVTLAVAAVWGESESTIATATTLTHTETREQLSLSARRPNRSSTVPVGWTGRRDSDNAVVLSVSAALRG